MAFLRTTTLEQKNVFAGLWIFDKHDWKGIVRYVPWSPKQLGDRGIEPPRPPFAAKPTRGVCNEAKREFTSTSIQTFLNLIFSWFCQKNPWNWVSFLFATSDLQWLGSQTQSHDSETNVRTIDTMPVLENEISILYLLQGSFIFRKFLRRNRNGTVNNSLVFHSEPNKTNK